MNGKEFLGCGLKFPLQVDRRTGRFAMVREDEDIREAIGIILRTVQGERVMRPEFGSNIMDYTFAPSSSSTHQSIVRQIQEQLLYQEPRIVDVDVRCRETDQQTGTIVVEVAYTVRATNNRYNHVYPFYLTEGSEGGGGA